MIESDDRAALVAESATSAFVGPALRGRIAPRILAHAPGCDRVRLGTYERDGRDGTDRDAQLVYPGATLVWIPLDGGDPIIASADEVLRIPAGLAVAFRAISGAAIVTRAMLTAMTSARFERMAQWRTHFAKRLAAFDVSQRDTLAFDEYDALFAAIAAREDAACTALGVTGLNNNQFDDLLLDLTLAYAPPVGS